MVSMSSQAVRCEKVAISRRQRTTEVIFIHYKKEVTYGLSNSIYIRQATSNTAISDDLKWPSRLLCYAEAQCRQIDKIDKLISIAPINSSESLSRLVSSYDKLADYFPAYWRINHVRLTRLSDDKHQKQHGHATDLRTPNRRSVHLLPRSAQITYSAVPNGGVWSTGAARKLPEWLRCFLDSARRVFDRLIAR